MSRVLVTGGAGFIGSHVVDKLRDAGHEPVLYDVRPSPFHVNGNRPDTVIGSILDIEALTEAMRGCDAVMHLAAAADVGEVEKAPVASEELNSRGTLAVLEAARNAEVKRVVYASTIWVYSDVKADHVDEDTPLEAPAHLYSATKLAGELYCRSYAELYGLEYTILRFGIPYGPRARPAAVIPMFVNKALAGDPLTLAGGGKQTRRFVYVEDLAEGCVAGLAPDAAGRIYNLVSDEDTAICDIAEEIQQIFGNVEIIHTEGRAGDFKGAEVSGTRAATELNWTAKTPFSEGVRKYVDWHVAAAAETPAPASAPAAATAPAPAATAAATAAPSAAVASAKPRRFGRPARATLVRDASLIAVGGAAGATIGLAAHFHTFRDRPTFLALIALLVIAALLMARVDWSRRVSDALIVVGSMVVFAGLALLVVAGAPWMVHAVRDNTNLVLFALGGLLLGGGVGATVSRAMSDRAEARDS